MMGVRNVPSQRNDRLGMIVLRSEAGALFPSDACHLSLREDNTPTTFAQSGHQRHRNIRSLARTLPLQRMKHALNGCVFDVFHRRETSSVPYGTVPVSPHSPGRHRPSVPPCAVVVVAGSRSCHTNQNTRCPCDHTNHNHASADRNNHCNNNNNNQIALP